MRDKGHADFPFDASSGSLSLGVTLLSATGCMCQHPSWAACVASWDLSGLASWQKQTRTSGFPVSVLTRCQVSFAST